MLPFHHAMQAAAAAAAAQQAVAAGGGGVQPGSGDPVLGSTAAPATSPLGANPSSLPASATIPPQPPQQHPQPGNGLTPHPGYPGHPHAHPHHPGGMPPHPAAAHPFHPHHGGLGPHPMEPPRPRFLFKMPRVVPNQKEKFETEDLMKRHSREGEVRSIWGFHRFDFP